MSQQYEELDAGYVLTLDEITNLTEEGGKIVWWWQRLVLGAQKSSVAK